ncbi:tight junction-associated protein 1 [Stegastes partitus]|uniref:Tight junction-associated protein 1 n=1 Tax=Stegastes partitus TaxID=144197 RepID=A0A9Y4NFY7_9TELE|nr:PREDICTED: tight junction-associated protein 1 [Stegastes partitus]
MTSAAPARKPYRKAPPQHRETRHALPAAPPPPAPQPDINQVNKHTLNTLPHLPHPHAGCHRPHSAGSQHCIRTSPLPLSDSELDVSSISSLELCITPTPLFSGHTRQPDQTRTMAVGVTASDHHTKSPYRDPRPQHATKSSISGGNASLSGHRSPARRHSPACSPRGGRRRTQTGTRTSGVPKSILKQPASLAVEHTYDIMRKSKSVELLDDSAGRGCRHPPTRSLDRAEPRAAPVLRRSSAPSSPCRSNWNWRMQVLEDKVRFSNFLDEITCRVLSPARLTLLGRSPAREPGSPTHERRRHRVAYRSQQVKRSSDRTRRWDGWVAALRRPDTWYEPLQEEAAGRETQQRQDDITEGARPKEEVNRGVQMEVQDTTEPQRHITSLSNMSLLSHIKAAVSQTWVHALRKVERDKKTMDQEIVELTNKLLDAKNTIDRLEELNERYRQDCNLAVQLLKCNKSHFRNHKFADLPSELQDMLNKHMKSSLPERGSAPQDPDTLSLTPADVVPTSVIARVLEKPEPLVLNSAQSSSCGRPVAEDVFVHVDMTGSASGAEGRAGRENGGREASQQNGSCRSQSSLDEEGGGASSFEKLNPYPAPPPPHPLYPGRKVIEFSSDDKVKIPKNSPLPNCTYATRQAISLSLVQNDDERLAPGSPAPSSSSGGGATQRTPPSQRDAASEPLSSQSSPFSSPPQAPSVMASSGSSEEDLLANWQRMFVEKMAPACDGSLVHRTSFSSQTAQELQRRRPAAGGGASSSDHHRAAYSDGEEGSSARSWTPSRGSSLDTDTDTEPRPGRRGRYDDASPEEGEGLLMNLEDDGGSGDTAVTVVTGPASTRRKDEEDEEDESSTEERDVLPHDLPVISPRLLDFDPALNAAAAMPQRPQKSPKRMGVHHLHRKDSLTRAQEHGTLLD